MKILLVRHGKTPGNLQKRYVGRTDEPLSEIGIKELKDKKVQNIYPKIDELVISPMVRCRQTASIIFPKLYADKVIVEPKLREMDFGYFEYKNFEELDGDPEYQEYLDSGGYRNFPGGETLQGFEKRCVEGFLDTIKELEKMCGGVQSGKDTIVGFVAHGGTIMAIMNRLCTTKKSYYEWMLDNGAFYLCEWTGEALCLSDA